MTKYCTDKPMAQGDLLIIPVDKIPEKVKPSKVVNGEYVVAHSETGHHHVIEKDRADVFEDIKNSYISFIETFDRGADIIHKRDYHTHETINLAPNRKYEIRRQREHVSEGFRPALD